MRSESSSDGDGDSIISYQLHSRNDLREWNALFRKGATSLKVDPHFLNSSDQFILSHDAPLPWQLLQHSSTSGNPYSTLDDLLLYLQSAPTSVHNKTIAIDLCFKAAPKNLCNATSSKVVSSVPPHPNNNMHPNDDDDDPPDDHDTTSEVQRWFQMTDAFFAKADPVVEDVKQRFGITLVFILDGDAKPCDCLVEKFLPWNSTYIDHNVCSLECYNSNVGFCHRFSILNEPTSSDWAGMATNDNHYGKFGVSPHQTLQVWEPDSQEEIGSLVDGYMEGRRQGVPSGSGLTFAINVDIAMFDTFTARSLQGTDQARGFHLAIQDENTVYPRAPKLVYTKPGEMILQYAASTSIDGSFQKRHRTISFVPFTEIHVGPPENDTTDETRLLHRSGTHAGQDRARLGIQSDNDKIDAHIRTQFGHHAVVQSRSMLEVGDYSFLFLAVQGKVYAYATTTNEQVKDNKVLIETDFRLIGLGTSVHASILNNTLLLVTEGNNCYNSHIHNTQTSPLVCEPQIDPARHSCDYAIDYSVGLVENWFHWLQQQQQHQQTESTTSETATATVITPCNEFILHGTVTAGHKPSGALFSLEDTPSKSQTEGTRIGIMIAHEPYPLQTTSSCGTPVRGETGIVLSAFSSPVVHDRFKLTFVNDSKDARLALETTGSWNSNLEANICFGSLCGILICWMLLRWKRRQQTNPCSAAAYETIP